MMTRSKARAWLPYAIAATAGFLLAFGAVAAVLFPADDTVQEVRVPSVTGLPLQDAQRRLKAAGLTATVGTPRSSADVPKGSIVAQTPIAGETVNAGTAVTLEVSEGQAHATVPALLGRAQGDAEQLLKDAGLALGEVTEQPSDTARGTVLDATPAAGANVPPGTKVALVVSAGPHELSLPDVVGRDLAMARGTLEQLGLTAVIEYDSLSSLPRGTVVAQAPAAGASITGGTAVTLRVSGKP